MCLTGESQIESNRDWKSKIPKPSIQRNQIAASLQDKIEIEDSKYYKKKLRSKLKVAIMSKKLMI